MTESQGDIRLILMRIRNRGKYKRNECWVAPCRNRQHVDYVFCQACLDVFDGADWSSIPMEKWARRVEFIRWLLNQGDIDL